MVSRFYADNPLTFLKHNLFVIGEGKETSSQDAGAFLCEKFDSVHNVTLSVVNQNL